MSISALKDTRQAMLKVLVNKDVCEGDTTCRGTGTASFPLLTTWTHYEVWNNVVWTIRDKSFANKNTL